MLDRENIKERLRDNPDSDKKRLNSETDISEITLYCTRMITRKKEMDGNNE